MVRNTLIILLMFISGCHFIATGEMKPAAEVNKTPDDRCITIATIKYMLSPEWTIEDYKKEIKYQQLKKRDERWR